MCVSFVFFFVFSTFVCLCAAHFLDVQGRDIDTVSITVFRVK